MSDAPLERVIDTGDRSGADFQVGDVVYDYSRSVSGTITEVRPMSHGRFIYDHTGLGPGTPNLAISDYLGFPGVVTVRSECDE